MYHTIKVNKSYQIQNDNLIHSVIRYIYTKNMAQGCRVDVGHKLKQLPQSNSASSTDSSVLTTGNGIKYSTLNTF